MRLLHPEAWVELIPEFEAAKHLEAAITALRNTPPDRPRSHTACLALWNAERALYNLHPHVRNPDARAEYEALRAARSDPR